LIAMRDYLDGINQSYDLSIAPTSNMRPVFRTELSQNLMSRFVWRAAQSYQYDAVQLLKNKLGQDRLLLLFNYAEEPVTFNLTVRGLYDSSFDLANFATGESLGTHGRLALEAGEPTVTVPARDCLMIRMTAVTEEK
jgi:hypothetical protein